MLWLFPDEAEGMRNFAAASRYGNLARAWRLGLDRDGNGLLSRGEFFLACRSVNYYGHPRAGLLVNNLLSNHTQ